MSTTTLHPTAPAVNPPMLLAAPDPTDAVVRYASDKDITFSEALADIRAHAVNHPADTPWKRSVLAAAERLADTERAIEIAENKTMREMYHYGGNAGRYCRQCRKWNGCGHVTPKGR